MSIGTIQAEMEVTVTLRRRTDGFYVAEAVVKPAGYWVTPDLTLPLSVIAIEPTPSESYHPARAISYALAELAAKIGGGR